MLKEKISDKSIAASVIGFSGVLIIISGRWSGHYSEDVGRGIVAILMSALLYAYNLILQRQQALLARPVEIAFFQNATLLAVYLCVASFYAVVPALNQLPDLAGAAVLGMASLLLLSWAYARAARQKPGRVNHIETTAV